MRPAYGFLPPHDDVVGRAQLDESVRETEGIPDPDHRRTDREVAAAIGGDAVRGPCPLERMQYSPLVRPG